jgi:CDP-diglyceride synthetase
MANFLTLPIFKDIILPFVLVFVLIYAILEKSKLLGEDKHQINAIISLVIAGILITFSTQVEWIRQFIVFLVIALVVLFVFMLLYGFAYAGKEGFELAKGWKMAIAGIAFAAVVIATLMITGQWSRLYDFFTSSSIGANVIFAIIIVGALIAVVFGGGKGEKKG